jgi:uncharacterized protein (TIGR00369 family)
MATGDRGREHVTGGPTPAEIDAMVREAFPGSEVRCAEVGPTHALARLDVAPSAIRPGGFVSGPTQFAVADAALWYVVFGAIGRIEPMALTSELSIRFLRPAQGTTLWGRADLDSAGRRNVVATIRLWVDDRDDRVVSVAQGTYALPLT